VPLSGLRDAVNKIVCVSGNTIGRHRRKLGVCMRLNQKSCCSQTISCRPNAAFRKLLISFQPSLDNFFLSTFSYLAAFLARRTLELIYLSSRVWLVARTCVSSPLFGLETSCSCLQAAEKAEHFVCSQAYFGFYLLYGRKMALISC